MSPDCCSNLLWIGILELVVALKQRKRSRMTIGWPQLRIEWACLVTTGDHWGGGLDHLVETWARRQGSSTVSGGKLYFMHNCHKIPLVWNVHFEWREFYCIQVWRHFPNWKTDQCSTETFSCPDFSSLQKHLGLSRFAEFCQAYIWSSSSFSFAIIRSKWRTEVLIEIMETVLAF